MFAEGNITIIYLFDNHKVLILYQSCLFDQSCAHNLEKCAHRPGFLEKNNKRTVYVY